MITEKWSFKEKDTSRPVLKEDYAHQTHYAGLKIEPFDYINSNKFTYWQGSVIKYISRAGRKRYDGMDDKDSELADCKKALWFLTKRIEELSA